MDFNKLIRDIIKAAKEDPSMRSDNPDETFNMITTLKLEVRVSKNTSQLCDEEPRNSTKLVLLTINDR